MSVVGQFHFAVGTLAVTAGFLALFVKKGSILHRRAGSIYVISIMMLCLSGFYMSFVRDLQFTFLLSAFSMYLVSAGWLAVQRETPRINAFDKISFYYITLFCVACFSISIMGVVFDWRHPSTEPGYAAYAFIGTCATLFLIGDISYLKKTQVRNQLRIKRHITRMGSSMLIATIVFFLGNNHVLPEFMRKELILSTPIFAVVIFMLFYRLRQKSFVGN